MQGLAAAANFANLTSLAIDAADDIYLVDGSACHVRRIDAATGTIHNVAGIPGTYGYSGPGYGDLNQSGADGDATQAFLNQPGFVRLDGQANMYIASAFGRCTQDRCDPIRAELYRVQSNEQCLHAARPRHSKRRADGDCFECWQQRRGVVHNAVSLPAGLRDFQLKLSARCDQSHRNRGLLHATDDPAGIDLPGERGLRSAQRKRLADRRRHSERHSDGRQCSATDHALRGTPQLRRRW